MLVLTWISIISHITELTRINSPLLLAASSNDFWWRDSHAPLEEQAEGLAPALGTVLLWRRLLGHSWPAILSCSWNRSLTCSWSLWGWLRLLATLGLTVLVTWCGARLYMPAISCRCTRSVACSAGVALEQTPQLTPGLPVGLDHEQPWRMQSTSFLEENKSLPGGYLLRARSSSPQSSKWAIPSQNPPAWTEVLWEICDALRCISGCTCQAPHVSCCLPLTFANHCFTIPRTSPA